VNFRAARDLGDALRDGDFDGTTDAAENIAGRNPADPADLAFEFTTAGDFEGWVTASVSSATVTGGALTGSARSFGMLTREGIHLPGDAITNLLFRQTASLPVTVSLQWARADDHTYNAALRQISLNLAANTPTSLVAALSSHPEWAGRTITGIRILPVSGSATTAVVTDWLRASSGDLDGDVLPDAYESDNGLDAADPADGAADVDGDGQTRTQEFIWGTSDTDPAAFFRPAATFSPGAGFTLTWDALADRSYTIWRSLTLREGSWVPIDDTGVLDADAVVEFSDPSSLSQPEAFYKIEGEYHGR
jgi:hypothetical protein